VRQHLVDEHPNAELVCSGDQRVEVLKRAEHRIDSGIVTDIVAEIAHRRGKERRDPNRVGAEVGDIGEAPGDAGKVADAVTVRVLEGPGIDLVDHGTAPPVVTAGAKRRGLWLDDDLHLHAATL
jgi:hypothetical protein